MLSPLKKPKNNKKDSELHDVIYAKVTKENHKHESPDSKRDETLRKCKQLFKQGASPKVLTELEELLRGKEYEYYIQHFLPALKAEIIKSKELNLPKKVEIEKIIMGPITSDAISKSSSVSSIPSAVKENIADQMQLGHIEIEEQNNKEETFLGVAKESGNKMQVSEKELDEFNRVLKEFEEYAATEFGGNNDLNSGIDSPGPNEESLASPINSRRSSISSTLSSAEEGNDSVLSEQIAEKKPQVQENENSDGQEGEISSQIKGGLKSNGEKSEQALPAKKELKLEEKEEEAVLSKQEASNNQNNSEVKQPNNRNLHVALVAGCALLAVGYLVAGAMTSGLLGAGLLVMATVFAIATAVTWYLTPPSSELTSTNLSRPVDDEELTACSHL